MALPRLHHRPVPYRAGTLSGTLNRFFQQAGLRDAQGEQVVFRAHELRHSVGTRMINNGVPSAMVQRYLGHASATSTQRYVHVHDMSLKAAVAQFHGRLVTAEGLPTDVLWPEENGQDTAQQLQAQALPNGLCGLPAGKAACPHANACLTCVHFRTSARFLGVHRAQQQELAVTIEEHERRGWARFAEMNQQMKDRLDRIVTTLEDADSTGGPDARA